MKPLALSLLAFGLAAAATAAAAPPPAPTATPSFDDRVDVRVVNVEVVVTDRGGLRVGGLAPGDFRLKVDGREVPIDYFTEVRGGAAVAPAGRGVQGLPSVLPGAPVGNSYLVYLDDFFSFAPNRNEELGNLKKDLGRMGPDDRMAIVAFDGKKLTQLSGWTSSQADLAAAIDAAMARPAFGLQRLGELTAYEGLRSADGRGRGGLSAQFGRPGGNGGRGGFGNDRGIGRLNFEQLPFAERLAEQVGHSVDAAVATLHGFASPPGRKVMLLFAGAWPYSPADYVVNNAKRPIEQELPRGDQLLGPLDDTANLLGYTIYPIDSEGLDKGDAFSARSTEVRATLDTLAEQTGGQPILAGHHDSPLSIAADDTRSYYWIGFTPALRRDDVRHQLRVDVVRRGLTARARQDYLDLSQRGEATMAVEAAMLFGNAPAGPGLPVQLGQTASSGWHTMRVPVTVAIPVSGVTFVPLDGKFVSELELRVSALDRDGHRSNIPAVPFKLTLDRQPDAGKFIPYDTTVELRKIDQRMTIAIVDRLSDRILTSSTEVKETR